MNINKYIVMSVVAAGLIGMTGCSSDSSDSSDGNTQQQESKEVFIHNIISVPDQYEGQSGDNNFSSAGNISIGEIQTRSIFPPNDDDYVAVQLQAGSLYEFFMTNLPETGDSEIYLYDENLTQLANNDDYINYDSNIQEYNATYTGTYYIKAVSLDAPYGTFDYQLGVREWVDVDNDGDSAYFDCNDNNSSIYPDAPEIAGNGIDEDCSGVDALAGADPYENDDDPSTAKPIAETLGAYDETEYRKDIYSQMRTIDDVTDIDYYKIVIPAKEVVNFRENSNSNLTSYNWALLESNGSIIDSGDNVDSIYSAVTNVGTTPVTVYLKVESDGISTGWYVPAAISLGEDKDGDGSSTNDYWEYDCDDNNASINPGATDAIGDGIDADCNGIDG